jgi:RimJ/RimL family protein N-acetyltransferase
MVTIPLLETARLHLRPFTPDDAPAVERLAGAAEVADTTLNIPHPYPEGIALRWIESHGDAAERGLALTWAITDRASGELYGAISLALNQRHAHAELGYWLGLPYWNRGYTTEAAAVVLTHGFTVLGLHRVVARHFARNPASGRVMQKIGMQHEGVQREHFRKGERFEDLVCYGILRTDWMAQALRTGALSSPGGG